MRKGWLVVLVIVIAGYLAFSFANSKKQSVFERYDRNFHQYDQNLFNYAMTNFEIQDGVLRNAYMGTKPETEKGQASISDIITNIKSLTAQMEAMDVPKAYQQAHGELLAAYQDFERLLTSYQQAVETRDITDSDLEKLTTGYVRISQASDKWYAVYKKREPSFPQPPNSKMYEVIGKDQDLMYYAEVVRYPIEGVIGELETNLLPAGERQDYSAVDKYMGNTKTILVRGIAYYKHVRVPEPFSDVHQELFDSAESLYDLLVNTDYVQINGEFLEKVTEHDKQLKQALEQWEQVREQVQ